MGGTVVDRSRRAADDERMRRSAVSASAPVALLALGLLAHGCTTEREGLGKPPGGGIEPGVTATGAGGSSGDGGASSSGATNSGGGTNTGGASTSSNPSAGGGSPASTSGEGGGSSTNGPAGTGGDPAGSGTGGEGGNGVRPEVAECSCLIDRFATDACEECFVDVVDCATESSACNNDIDCLNLKACIAAEQCSDVACLESCGASASWASVDLYNAFATCQCGECSASCNVGDVCE